MAVTLSNDYCFVDEYALWNETGCVPPKKIFFDIWEPFRKSKINEILNDVKGVESDKTSTVSRKRKRGHGAVFMEDAAIIVKNAYVNWKHTFSCKKTQNEKTNDAAREAASNVANFGFLEKLSDVKDESLEIKSINTDDSITLVPLTLFKNDADQAAVITFDSQRFYVPQNAAFVPGPVSTLKHLDYANRHFDLIVLDPPWPNKSVKRLRTYKTFEIDDLLDLPIEQLTVADGIVAIWLTNNPTVHASVSQILETWDLVEVGRWHWLKVTRTGEPIVPFDWGHKVPFEDVVFARKACLTTEMMSFPKELTIISTPSASHSRKPPLGLLLPKVLHREFKQKLEVYGRYLIPDTTTIGFEALKFQHIDTALDFDLS